MSIAAPVLNLVRGLPNDRKIICVDTTNARFMWNGTVSFPDYIMSSQPFHTVWIGPSAPKVLNFKDSPIINDIADADICGLALKSASECASKTSLPWFNHPARVLKNTREEVVKRLADIPGLIVPNTIRIKPVFRREIISEIENNNFYYPVLIRIAGNHGGLDIVRLDSASDIEKIDSVPWGGKELYITQAVEFKNRDGIYRKQRFAVIGGSPILRHSMIGSSWLLHNARRLWDDRSQEEEAHLLTNVAEHIEYNVADRVKIIYDRLGLDFFGIDCSLQDDGSVVLFEANAAMNTLVNNMPSPNMWDKPISRIKSAILDLINKPELWVDKPVNTKKN